MNIGDSFMSYYLLILKFFPASRVPRQEYAPCGRYQAFAFGSLTRKQNPERQNSEAKSVGRTNATKPDVAGPAARIEPGPEGRTQVARIIAEPGPAAQNASGPF